MKIILNVSSLILAIQLTTYLSYASTENTEDEEISRRIQASRIKGSVVYRARTIFYSKPQQPREDTLGEKFRCRHNPATSSIETTLLKEDPNSTER